MSDIPPQILSPLLPDIDLIRNQLQSGLASRSSWNNILTAGTGQTLIDNISSIGGLNQTAIARAQQELYFGTAAVPSSIYVLCRSRGIHIIRKRPAYVPVTFTRTILNAPLALPAYTQFIINGLGFFNRSPIAMNVGQAITNITLYQGIITTTIFTSDGTPDQDFEFGTQDFSISDDDLFATINGVQWSKDITGLWHFNQFDLVFFENSLPNGNVEARFGDGTYGAIPAPNQTITFTYAVTEGSDVNGTVDGYTVSFSGNSDLIGITDDVIGYGDNERSPLFYKLYGPGLYTSQQQAVTRLDHNALAASYQSVIDAVVLGQAETHPTDLRWMNIVVFVLLTNTPWNVAQWNAFVQYFTKNYEIATVQMYQQTPIEVPVIFSATLYCFPRADLTNTQQTAETQVTNYFAVQPGSLGADYFSSDISEMLSAISDNQGPLIDYFDFTLTPGPDLNLTNIEYAKLISLVINVQYSNRTRGGVIVPNSLIGPIGPYDYVNPLTGATLVAVQGLGSFIIDPAGELAQVTVTVPPYPSDGQIFGISTTKVIDALTVNAPVGQLLVGGGPFMLSADGGISFRYVAAQNTWYRLT